jgi:NAD-dependent deacetylase
MDRELLDRVAGWIRAAEIDVEGFGGVTVLTGAGVSTDSGIPDFRGPDGVWTKNPEAERLATIDVYLSDPEARRQSWRWRMDHPAWKAEPNAAHKSLVDLRERGRLQAVVTQNIDGLHQKAGMDPAEVVEVHGSMREVVCVDCDHTLPTTAVFERVQKGEQDPACAHCGGILKTGTIFFGQPLDEATIEKAQLASIACDVFIAAGTSLQVYPVAWLPSIARGSGARVVIVNGEPTPHDDEADVVLRGGVGEILPAIVERV